MSLDRDSEQGYPCPQSFPRPRHLRSSHVSGGGVATVNVLPRPICPAVAGTESDGSQTCHAIPSPARAMFHVEPVSRPPITLDSETEVSQALPRPGARFVRLGLFPALRRSTPSVLCTPEIQTWQRRFFLFLGTAGLRMPTQDCYPCMYDLEVLTYIYSRRYVDTQRMLPPTDRGSRCLGINPRYRNRYRYWGHSSIATYGAVFYFYQLDDENCMEMFTYLTMYCTYILYITYIACGPQDSLICCSGP